jgi:hypothetical protein
MDNPMIPCKDCISFAICHSKIQPNFPKFYSNFSRLAVLINKCDVLNNYLMVVKELDSEDPEKPAVITYRESKLEMVIDYFEGYLK